VVVQWLETLPVTQADYDTQRPGAFYQILIEQRVAFLENWFDPQQIRARARWEAAKPEETSETPEGQEEDKPEPTGQTS